MRIKTLLILGRVSNLPTVWSNLLAGWCLVGGRFDVPVLAAVLIGGSFLYTGGMFLNDFCDAGFDSRYRPERPIPAGLVSRHAVGWIAIAGLLLGTILLATLGLRAFVVSFQLLACIVLYNVIHKKIGCAPFIMGACRLLLYFLAASAAGGTFRSAEIHSLVPAGLALGLYVAGITYFARGESAPKPQTRWSLIFLLLPVWLVPFGGANQSRIGSALFSLLFLLWMGWLLVPFWRGTKPSIGRVVSGLLAAIVLVDCIAVAPVLGFQAAWFLILFIFALLLQRIIPAT